MNHSKVTFPVLIGCLFSVSATAYGDEPAPPAAQPNQSQTEPIQPTPTSPNASNPEVGLDSSFGFGFGGGGFGGEGFASSGLGLPESAIPGRNWVDGGTLIIATSDDGKKAFGYSEQHPRWAEQDLEPLPDVKPIPVVGSAVAAVMQGHFCHAYSPVLGKWDTLKLPVGESAVPQVGDDSASVHSASQGDYVFKSSWGKWFSADEIKAGRVAEHLLAQRNATPAGRAEDGVAEERITIFQLKYVQAREAIRIVQQLYGPSVKRAAVDERTNSLIVASGDQSVFAKIRELLQAIDSPTAKDLALPQPAQSVDELRELYNELDQQSQRLAARLRERGQSDPAAKQLPAELRDAVRKAFEARQSLQRAELADFAKRLEGIRQSIEARDRIADNIVDRRVQELLDPNVRWEGDNQTRTPDGVGLEGAVAERGNENVGNYLNPPSGTTGSDHAQIQRATELRTVIVKLVDEVASYEAIIKHSPQHDDIGGITKRLETSRRNLLIYRDELAAHIRLLELQLIDAESAAILAAKDQERLKRFNMAAANTISAEVLGKSQRDLDAARSRVRHVSMLLELYKKIDSEVPQVGPGETEQSSGAIPSSERKLYGPLVPGHRSETLTGGSATTGRGTLQFQPGRETAPKSALKAVAEPAMLKGQILDQDEQPIEGAVIRIERIRGLRMAEIAKANTDGEGRFHIRDLPPGEFELFVDEAGVSAIDQKLLLTEGENSVRVLIWTKAATEELRRRSDNSNPGPS